MKKKILGVMLVLAMLLLMPVIANAAESGTCGANGDNLTWTLDNTGTLTISGEGKMKNYEYDNPSPFYNDNDIKSVIIENGVTSIGDYAFYDCSSLISVTIPDSVTNIRGNAFYDCNSLINITIGNSITSIGGSAFSSCNSLTNVYITDIVKWCNIEYVDDDDNPLYYANNLYINGELVKNIEIPNGVTKIPPYAFSCNHLESITIPDSVTSIDDSAFNNCENLISITIGDSVTSIGNFTFDSCDSLTSITIPDSVTSIGKYTFAFCNSLESVTIGNGITTINEDIFYYCYNLKTITVPTSVTLILANAFDGCDKISSVCYAGTQQQWNAITIAKGNDALTNAKLYTDGVTPPITEKTYDGEIIMLLLQAEPGGILDKPPQNKGFIVRASYRERTRRFDGDDYFFVAAYDKSGALLSLDYVQMNFPKDSNVTVGFHIQPQSKEIKQIKAYAWSNFDSLKPLAKTKTIDF